MVFANDTFRLSGALSLGTNSFQKALEAGQANFGIIDYEQSRELFLSVVTDKKHVRGAPLENRYSRKTRFWILHYNCLGSVLYTILCKQPVCRFFRF